MKIYLTENLWKCYRSIMFFITICFLFTDCTGSKSMILDAQTIDTANSVVEEAMQVVSPSSAHILFDSSNYHFGSVKQGGIVYREILFTNDGGSDLDIQLISACECTQLEWPQLPIKPGGSGIIKVRYDSKDKSGPQIVDIEVLANTTPEMSYTKFFIHVNP